MTYNFIEYVRQGGVEMVTKLTLRMDDAVIKDAKKLAGMRKVSLSRMISDYIKSISAQQNKEAVVSPILLEISGILSSKTNNKKMLKSYKKHIEDKYL